MLTRDDINTLDTVRFIPHPDGLMIYRASEGAMLVPVDSLPALLVAAAERLKGG
jgi:hypothetical protein